MSPLSLLEILSEAVLALDNCVQALATSVPAPQCVHVSGNLAFRHVQQDRNDLLLSFLKLVKIASHHNAALVLLQAGYVHEVYALAQMIDEACEDIIFMISPLGDAGQLNKDRRWFINEFYQEEFSVSNLVNSQHRRDRGLRDAIRATTNRPLGGGIDGFDPYHLTKLEGMFSGLVHGAYIHLMELYDGARFHTTGLLGAPSIEECADNQVNHVFRSLLAIELVGRRAARPDVVYQALDLAISLAQHTECLKPEEIRSLEELRARPLVKPT
jgi:hypothetical protein